MIRWLLYRFLPYFTLLFLVIGIGLLLVSETGLQLLWSQVEKRLPPEVKIESVGGRLIERVSVHGVEIETDGARITLDTAWLRWQPLALFGGRLHITDLVLAGGHIELTPVVAEDDEPPAPLPDALPWLPNVVLSRISLRRITLQPVAGEAITLTEANLRASLIRRQLRIDMQRLQLANWGDWQLALDGRLEPQRLRLDKLELSEIGERPLQLSLAGACDWPQLDCEARADWTALRWPLVEDRWRSPQGQATLTRRDGELRVEAQTRLEGEGLPATTIEATLSQAPMPAPLNWTVALDSAPATLTAAGDFSADSGRLNAQLAIERLDLAHWHADYPSALRGGLRLEARVGAELSATLRELALEGELRGAPLKLHAAGRYSAAEIAAETLQLDWGALRLSGRLRRGDSWQGRLSLDAPRLALVHPDLAGRSTLRLDISGPQAAPRLAWNLSAEDLAYADLTLAQLASEGEAGLAAGAPLRVTLKAKDLASAGLRFETLELSNRGRLSDWQGRLTLRESRVGIDAAWQGGWEPGPRRLTLTLGRFDLRPAGGEPWTLSEGDTLRWQAGGDLALPRHCWTAGDARSCVTARYAGERLAGDFRLENFNLASLQPRLPPTALIDGRIDLSARIDESPLAALEYRAELKTGPIRVSTPDEGEALEVLRILPGGLSLRGQGRVVEAQLSLPVEAGDGLIGSFALAADGQAEGRLVLGLENLDLLPALVPEVLRADGRIGGELTLGGRIEAPQLRGELALTRGRIALATPEIELGGVTLGLRGQQGAQLSLFGGAESGDGRLELAGQLDWRDAALRLDATLKGKRFLASNTAVSRVRVSPDLALAVNGRDVRLSGRLVVPEALIRPKSLGGEDGPILPSEDQVILGEEPPPPPYRLSSRLTLELGPDVRFEGLGLTAGIRGQLDTRAVAGRVPTATGELSLVNGRYKAYGQDLTIERGRLIFSGGPIVAPGLDLRAYRQARADVRVGVQVRGPLGDPSFSLYSDPSMRETDQLSYLVLGRPAESENEADSAAINNAALALGLKGGDFLGKRFKSKLGLDEVRIGAQPGETTEQAALVLGKYLTPDIFVSYGIGLFEPSYVFKLNYRLSDKWSLQSESGAEAGGDIIYTIER